MAGAPGTPRKRIARSRRGLKPPCESPAHLKQIFALSQRLAVSALLGIPGAAAARLPGCVVRPGAQPTHPAIGGGVPARGARACTHPRADFVAAPPTLAVAPGVPHPSHRRGWRARRSNPSEPTNIGDNPRGRRAAWASTVPKGGAAQWGTVGGCGAAESASGAQQARNMEEGQGTAAGTALGPQGRLWGGSQARSWQTLRGASSGMRGGSIPDAWSRREEPQAPVASGTLSRNIQRLGIGSHAWSSPCYCPHRVGPQRPRPGLRRSPGALHAALYGGRC